MFYQALFVQLPFLAVRRLAASVAGFPALWPVGLTHAQNEGTGVSSTSESASMN